MKINNVLQRKSTTWLPLALPLLLVSGACGGDNGATIDAGNADIDARAAVADAAVVDAAPAVIDASPLPDAFVAACTPTSGTSLDTQVIATGLESPVYLTAPVNDARLFVLEQPGQIRIIADDVLRTTPFLDISSIVRSTGNEQGLLGLAFPEDYAQSGRFYVNYTATSPSGATVIAEYQVSADQNVADPASARIVLTIPQPFGNHNGGMINFGPDGYLYIGMGDGGSGGDPQDNGENTATLLGSMLRIDVSPAAGLPYGIPNDNPFADSANGATDPRPEIWAYGVRNPWRHSFDRSTGDLYIADVGQNAFEEVNVQLAASAGGENYGWDVMEGAHCFEPSVGCDQTGLTLPIAEYTHAVGCSITGGYVYRGSCMPDLDGTYFLADFCSNQVSTLKFPTDNTLTPRGTAGELGANISSFGQDASGELYLVDIGGTISRLVLAAP